MQEIGKLDRIMDITDQTVPDYDYGKLLEERICIRNVLLNLLERKRLLQYSATHLSMS